MKSSLLWSAAAVCFVAAYGAFMQYAFTFMQPATVTGIAVLLAVEVGYGWCISKVMRAYVMSSREPKFLLVAFLILLVPINAIALVEVLVKLFLGTAPGTGNIFRGAAYNMPPIFVGFLLGNPPRSFARSSPPASGT